MKKIKTILITLLFAGFSSFSYADGKVGITITGLDAQGVGEEESKGVVRDRTEDLQGAFASFFIESDVSTPLGSMVLGLDINPMDIASGSVTIAGDLTVSGTTVTTNQQVVNVTEAFVFEGATADANETTFSIDEPTADRTVALPDKTGTIELLDGLILNSTDGSANAGDNIVQNTSANENDRILLEDATSDVLLVLASHGITLSGVGWNTFQFDNDHS